MGVQFAAVRPGEPAERIVVAPQGSLEQFALARGQRLRAAPASRSGPVVIVVMFLVIRALTRIHRFRAGAMDCGPSPDHHLQKRRLGSPDR